MVKPEEQLKGQQSNTDALPTFLKGVDAAEVLRIQGVATVLADGHIEVDREKGLLLVDGEEILLGSKAYKMLELLSSQPDRIFTPQEVLESIWGDRYRNSINVSVYVSELRKALGPEYSAIIQNKRKVGYFIDSTFIPVEQPEKDPDAPSDSVGLLQTEPSMAGLVEGMHRPADEPAEPDSADAELKDVDEDAADNEFVADDEVDFVEGAKRESRAKIVELQKKQAKKDKVAEALSKLAAQSVVTDQSDWLDASELWSFEDVLTHQKPRDKQEVLENEDVRMVVQQLLDRDGLVNYRSRVIIPLRFGLIPENAHKHPVFIRHGSESIRLEEAIKNLRNFSGRGADLETTSRITGFTEQAVLKTEIAFLTAAAKLSPQLAALASKMEAQLEMIQQQAAQQQAQEQGN